MIYIHRLNANPWDADSLKSLYLTRWVASRKFPPIWISGVKVWWQILQSDTIWMYPGGFEHVVFSTMFWYDPDDPQWRAARVPFRYMARHQGQGRKVVVSYGRQPFWAYRRGWLVSHFEALNICLKWQLSTMFIYIYIHICLCVYIYIWFSTVP